MQSQFLHYCCPRHRRLLFVTRGDQIIVISDLMMMFRLLITQDEIIPATSWCHRPGYPDDRLHNTWTPDPRVLSDNDEDVWEALVKGRKWKAKEIERLELNAFLLHFFWSISSPRQWPLTCCFWWWNSDSVIGAVSSSASLTTGCSIDIKKQWRGRGHFPVDVQPASLMKHPSCWSCD